MSKKSLFAALAAALAALALPCLVHAQETITLRADTWAPFNGEPDAQLPGYVVEIAKAVFEPKGYKIDYKTIPWNRAVKEVQEGKFDAAVGAAKEDCPDFVFPEEEIADIKYGFYKSPKNHWKYLGADSLKNVTLGVIDGYSYGEEVDKYIEAAKDGGKLQVMTGDGALEKNVKKLQAGRIDVLIDAPQVVSWTLKTMQLPEASLELAGSLEKSQKNYIAFSPAKPNSKKYAKILDDGVKELRKSGKLAEILAKYGLKDWRN